MTSISRIPASRPRPVHMGVVGRARRPVHRPPVPPSNPRLTADVRRSVLVRSCLRLARLGRNASQSAIMDAPPKDHCRPAPAPPTPPIYSLSPACQPLRAWPSAPTLIPQPHTGSCSPGLAEPASPRSLDSFRQSWWPIYRLSQRRISRVVFSLGGTPIAVGAGAGIACQDSSAPPVDMGNRVAGTALVPCRCR